jgi:hypothetical protein
MARGQALRSLANFFDAATDSWRIPWKGKDGLLEVGLDANVGYRQRTIRNASESDVTVSVARDRTTDGERLTRNSAARARKPIVELDHDSATFDADVTNLVARLNEVAAAKGNQPIVINAAGNGLSTLRANQDVADLYAMRLFQAVLNHPERNFQVAQLRSGGQTGYDIAFIKAALANDIPAKIHAARGRDTGNFLLRRRNNRDAELTIEEYLDELEVNGESIQKLVEKMRAGVQQAVAAEVPALPAPAFRSAMNYKDGDYGLSMRPEFAGKSTMDLIISGDRTGTSRRLDLLRNVSKGTVVEFQDTLGRTVLARATSNPRKLELPSDPEELRKASEAWSKLEGWAPENYERLARQNYGQYTYEVIAIDGKPVAAPPKPIVRIDLDEPTVAEVEAQRRLLEARPATIDRRTGQVDDALKGAIADEQSRLLGLSSTEARRIEVEKGEQKAALRDVERARRGAIERMRRGKPGGEGMELVTLDDLLRNAPELFDTRPTFDMDLQMDRAFQITSRERMADIIQPFSHGRSPASKMPAVDKYQTAGIREFLVNAFGSKGMDFEDIPPSVRRAMNDLGPEEFLKTLMNSKMIDDSVKAAIPVSRYYTSVLMADSYFPVAPVSIRARGAVLGAEGIEESVDIVRQQRVFDSSKLEGATSAEIKWLEDDGASTVNILLDAISGRWISERERTSLLKLAGARRTNLNRLRKEQASSKTEEIEQFLDYLFDAARSSDSVYSPVPAVVSRRPEATRFQTPGSAQPRIQMALRGRDGNMIEVDFQWDSIAQRVMPGKITASTKVTKDGKTVTRSRDIDIDELEELFDIDMSYKSLLGDTSKLNPYHKFQLGFRRRDGEPIDNLLSRQLSSRGLRFDDGESVLDKFVLDTLGYRGGDETRTVNQILLEAMATRTVEKRAGKEIVTWVPKKKPELFHAQTGRPAKDYQRQFSELVESALEIDDDFDMYRFEPHGFAAEENYDNLLRLAERIGRRQLSSEFDVNFWGQELTTAHVLTRIMQKQRLRNARPTRRFRANKVEEIEPERKVFVSRDDMPADGPLTDDEIWYAYRVGEIKDLPAEAVQEKMGIVRTTWDEESFLADQQIIRHHAHRIIHRQPRGRQFREPKPKTESQRAGRILPKTDEEKALLRAKMSDEYGFEVLMAGDDVVDIMRKPGSSRHFGNPYHIDDKANIIQRVHANTKFEYYLLNGQRVEQYSPGLDKMVVYDHASWMRRNIWRLRDKKLMSIDEGRYSHGDVLLQYAESTDMGILIDRYGDNPARLSAKVEEALLAHGRATRRDFESYISRFERQHQDQLTTLPTDVTYRVQVDDLFIERVNPRTGIELGPG